MINFLFVFFPNHKSVFVLSRFIENIVSWRIKWNISSSWLYCAAHRTMLVYTDGGQGKKCGKENVNS